MVKIEIFSSASTKKTKQDNKPNKPQATAAISQQASKAYAIAINNQHAVYIP